MWCCLWKTIFKHIFVWVAKDIDSCYLGQTCTLIPKHSIGDNVLFFIFKQDWFKPKYIQRSCWYSPRQLLPNASGVLSKRPNRRWIGLLGYSHININKAWRVIYYKLHLTIQTCILNNFTKCVLNAGKIWKVIDVFVVLLELTPWRFKNDLKKMGIVFNF